MEGHNHHHIMSVNVDTGIDRYPQWSVQETKEFLMIRAELDQAFTETKRNKLLWELISNKMKEKGYNRSAEQCKCKWKNLATRYKGYQTIEPSMRQQFPFYHELEAIFADRMQRMMWNEAEASGSQKRAVELYSDEDNDNEESEGEKGVTRKKKRVKSSANPGNMNSLREMLVDFMKQQMQMEVQWREAFEAREHERRVMEIEWRQRMEALESERLMIDRRWREREEQRRMREEARAEKRDALVTALLNKLRREDI
ncbi:hypothetical protein K2173_008496 [Erythroxylum novogranatense]|uniref:Myb-like domain-containing protein n=1 Tax=Erythroxylum novogranatense TaxID=1862640 RepID=A0AAV8UBU6_9ROSI|nr:hypothetical protein K2173_008496 [Erythroxylum novogranatense]